jgi:type II secretory pathway pseudopilin PulG
MRRQRMSGFTYLAALFVVALMGAGLALMSELWHTASLREKEAELLYVGHQYRRAIERYYLTGPQRQYPRTLQDLLKDPRTPTVQRYLRRLYPDPVTGTSEWILVKGPDGGIMGVHSASEERPFKIANFKLRDRELEGATKYADWKFVYTPPLQAKPKPAAPAGITPPVSPGATPSVSPGATPAGPPMGPAPSMMR